MEGVCSLFELCNPQMLSDFALSKLLCKQKKSSLSSRDDFIKYVMANISPKPQRIYRENRVGKRLDRQNSRRTVSLKRSSSDITAASERSKKFGKAADSSSYRSSNSCSTKTSTSTSRSTSTSTSNTSSSTGSRSPTKHSSSSEETSSSKRKKITWP
eukprot:TRINITY_DN15252_c1_g1_i1.p1 TRINITY_DN15252_c1_g1~~TRINITY_DN15252_c1_g1_i1.p1  ORF type:complete len:157 (+),score=15.33 TRINITY_DN15252_c1_g1_i1:76-546(+)